MSVLLKRKSSDDSLGSPSKNKKVQTEQDVEEKISELMTAVLSEPFGALVLIIHSKAEHPFVTLQNSLTCMNQTLAVTREDANKDAFQLQINDKVFVEGVCQNMQIAKKTLGEEALEKLKETCFVIQKKEGCVNVTKENLQASSSSVSDTVLETSSAAHKIMMKMGWTGGGLGAEEQGSLDTVTLYENVNRQGLGTSSLIKEITNKLESFSKSSKLNLVFNAEFNKEERALIHRVARKFNLKSKSSGSESRKLTVSKKITKLDIVKELLRIGGEDSLYVLQIPRKFRHLW